MNYYSASVALLWTTAMRGAALATEAHNGTPSRRPILPLAKSRCARTLHRITPSPHMPASRNP
jgi:hypothetical protein